MMLGFVFGSARLLVFIVGTIIHEQFEKVVNKRTEVSNQ